MSRKRLADDSDVVKQAITLYLEGIPYRDMAKIMNISKAALCNLMHTLFQEGVIIPRRQLKGRKAAADLPKKQPPGTVNCNLGVSRKCVYGACWTASSEGPLCNYILCTGHMRGCPANECDKFQAGKKKMTTKFIF